MKESVWRASTPAAQNESCTTLSVCWSVTEATIYCNG